ncbi:hypothetical protein DJ031_01325 [bacterium endosymbiont of Escarpia laminata]|nr:MAG: hypothetical protein DJ031_01325 [bacterium endosymbiont of Escarpia laminata]
MVLRITSIPPLNLLLLLWLVAPAIPAATLTPVLQNTVTAARSTGDLPVIIQFSDKLDIRALRKEVKTIISADRPEGRRGHRLKRQHAKRALIVDTMKRKARRSKRLIRRFLKARGEPRPLKSLWAINALAGEIPAYLIEEMAALPGVERISIDTVYTLAAPTGNRLSGLPMWNLESINAVSLWETGLEGQGIVVGVMDSGVDMNHPDLIDNWRGGDNSWFDPYGQHNLPVDFTGHGTQATGVILGGDASGYRIGAAPEAEWIAARIFDDTNRATLSAIHQAFQWMLDPDGDPNTDDAPDVVNNSWGFANTINECFQEFAEDIRLLKEADISVIFAAGNFGPNAESSISPANDPTVVSVGSVDSYNDIAISSSRGPGACDGGTFPKLVAPGENIFTADRLPLTYNVVSGTSFAAPHVAGAIALLKSAFPSATVSQLETSLLESSIDIGPIGADGDFGYGLLNVAGAYDWLIDDLGLSGAGILMFGEKAYSIDEKTKTLTLTLYRIGGSVGEISVDFQTSDISAISGLGHDYLGRVDTLVFSDGETARSFDITILDDSEDEMDEGFQITLYNPQGGAVLGGRSSVPVTILDDDGPGSLVFEALSYAVNESHPKVTLSVLRLGGSSGRITVDFATHGRSATAGADFEPKTGTLTFEEGVASSSISVNLLDDDTYEGNETFDLILSNATGGATLGVSATATVSLLDDDAGETLPTFTFSAPQYNVDESDGRVEITVQRLGDSSGSYSVDYKTAAGSAVEGDDFIQIDGTLNFLAGANSRTFEVEILNDGIFETAETFSLALYNPSSGSALGQTSATLIRIGDDDAKPGVGLFSAGVNGGLSGASTSGSLGTQSRIAAGGTAQEADGSKGQAGSFSFSIGNFLGVLDVNGDELLKPDDDTELQSSADADIAGDDPQPGTDCSEAETRIHPDGIKTEGDGINQDCKGQDRQLYRQSKTSDLDQTGRQITHPAEDGATP